MFSTCGGRACQSPYSIWALIVVVFMYASCSSPSTTTTSDKTMTFNLLSSQRTGIDFNNRLTEGFDNGQNVLDFDYFYNGAGVAIADFDNDGLKDLVFTGNQVDNQIYKNLGSLKFENKTITSGINENKFWSNGVTTIDINRDGLEDIYISQGGPYPLEKRRNLLFINQGDFKFIESAEAYGLADTGISTQAVFFDYDNDGDEDCYVSNETPAYGLDPISFFKFIGQQQKSLLHVSSGHLYLNEENQYSDITDKTGLLSPSFGLGVCVADLNEDNWLDLYVANDYYIPDAIYINDQKGGFVDQTNELTNQISFYGMGVDINDINNDGHQDILVLDMASADHYRSKTLMASMNTSNFDLLTKTLGFAHQYMFNSLLLNNSNNHYDNVAHLSGINKSDWSWAGLMVDFDMDEEKEIFITNGYKKYSKDNDFQKKVTALKNKYDGEPPLEEKEKLYAEIPSEKLANAYYDQTSTLKFNNIATAVGMGTPTFSNGAATADLDNDGDLDLVINNIDDEAFVYKNLSIEGGRKYSITLKSDIKNGFIKATSYKGPNIQFSQSKRVSGYLSSTVDDIVFGYANNEPVDSIVIQYRGMKKSYYDIKPSTVLEIKVTQLLQAAQLDAKKDQEIALVGQGYSNLAISHIENEYNDFNTEVLLPYKQSGLGPKLVSQDLNEDEVTDIFVAGAINQSSYLYLSEGSMNYSRVKIPGSSTEDISAVFFDLENDGDQDMYIITGGNALSPNSIQYEDKLVLSMDGRYRLRNDLMPKEKNRSAGSTGAKIDFNKDGYEDLIICNRIIPQNYPRHAPSQLLMNREGRLVEATSEFFPDLETFGIINDIEVFDFDNDGWQDVMIVGEWTGVGLYRNNKGTFENISNKTNLQDNIGWWYSITKTDINNDSRPDFVIGNLGLNSKYKASKEKPFKIFANDFDKNGSLDIVLGSHYKGKEVPFRGLECSSEQMPFIKDKFKSYSAFANASLIDVYGAELEKAYSRSCTDFKSYALVSSTDGYEALPLPTEVQTRPILDGISTDLNKDGYQDLILVGNIYNTEVETPRLDFKNGSVLISDGKTLSYSDYYSRMVEINKNSKSIVKLQDQRSSKSLIVVGNNDEEAILFKLK